MSGSEFILILVLHGAGFQGMAATSILFPTEAACEQAKGRAEQRFSGWNSPNSRALCVPRNTP